MSNNPVLVKKPTNPNRRKALIGGSTDLFGLPGLGGHPDALNGSKHVRFGGNKFLQGADNGSPVKRQSIKVDINKDQMDHLEREEKKTMNVFIRKAKKMGTVNAIQSYLKSVNIDEIDDIVNRYGVMETLESDDEGQSLIKQTPVFDPFKEAFEKDDLEEELEAGKWDKMRRRRRMFTVEAMRRKTVLKTQKTYREDNNNMLDNDDEFDMYWDEDEEDEEGSTYINGQAIGKSPNKLGKRSRLSSFNFKKSEQLDGNPKIKKSSFGKSKFESMGNTAANKLKDSESNTAKKNPGAGTLMKGFGKLNSFGDSVSKKCLINPEGAFKLCWDHFQMLLILYVATLTPFKFSFVQDGDFPTWEYIDYIIDFFFTVDIFITLFTPIRINNKLVTSKLRILWQYTKTTLFFDLISVLPLDLIFGGAAQGTGGVTKLAKFAKAPRIYKMMKITKLLRTLRMGKKKDTFFSKVVRYFSRSDLLMISIVPIYIGSMIVAQIFCCVWHLIANTSSNPENWLVQYGYLDETTHDRFWASMYYVYATFTTTGYGDILPHTNVEFLVTIFMMILGVLFYSFLYTTIIGKFEK